MARTTHFGTGIGAVAVLFLVSGAAVFAQPAPDTWDSRLTDMGLTWTAPTVTAGQTYWRLVAATYEDEQEAQGLHHMFYKCLDYDGTQLGGVEVIQIWADGSTTAATKAPPDWGDIAMYGGNWCPSYPPGPYSGAVNDGTPSYTLVGCGMPCNLHVCYRMTFQKTVATTSWTGTGGNTGGSSSTSSTSSSSGGAVLPAADERQTSPSVCSATAATVGRKGPAYLALLGLFALAAVLTIRRFVKA